MTLLAMAETAFNLACHWVNRRRRVYFLKFSLLSSHLDLTDELPVAIGGRSSGSPSALESADSTDPLDSEVSSGSTEEAKSVHGEPMRCSTPSRAASWSSPDDLVKST